MNDKNEALLPRWRSHKLVWADKIVGVEDGAGLVLMRWRLACGAVIDVDEALASRPLGRPVVGGYYVRYDGGFQSWSPADAFEGGYTRVTDGAAPGTQGQPQTGVQEGPVCGLPGCIGRHSPGGACLGPDVPR